MPRVTINIVTWNSAAYIDRCLKQIWQQTYTDFEVLIIDNNSQDQTVHYISEHDNPKLRIIENQDNLGFAKAHNLGIGKTAGEFVLLLNPDVFLTPSFLDRLIRGLDSNSDSSFGSANGKLLQLPSVLDSSFPSVDQCLIDSAGLIMQKNRRQYLRGYLEPANQCCLESEAIFGPDGAAPIYRRSMLEDVAIDGEYFDELLITHKEDVDLAWRAQLLGWNCLYVPEALAYHIRHFRPGDRKGIARDIRRTAVRNRWLIMYKNELVGLLLKHLPRILIYELGILGYILLHEQYSMLAYIDFLKYLPTMYQKRHIIQGRIKRDHSYMERWFHS